MPAEIKASNHFLRYLGDQNCAQRKPHFVANSHFRHNIYCLNPAGNQHLIMTYRLIPHHLQCSRTDQPVFIHQFLQQTTNTPYTVHPVNIGTTESKTLIEVSFFGVY